MKQNPPSAEMPATKRKLLEASVALMRTKGFNGTSVDDICTSAGVTKGGFFHYFKSKDEAARAAAQSFCDTKAESYRTAPNRALADPLDRVFGRLDFMVSSASSGDSPTLGCLIGMLAQELSSTHPDLRAVFVSMNSSSIPLGHSLPDRPPTTLPRRQSGVPAAEPVIAEKKQPAPLAEIPGRPHRNRLVLHQHTKEAGAGDARPGESRTRAGAIEP